MRGKTTYNFFSKLEYFSKTYRKTSFCVNQTIGHFLGFALPLLIYFNRDWYYPPDQLGPRDIGMSAPYYEYNPFPTQEGDARGRRFDVPPWDLRHLLGHSRVRALAGLQRQDPGSRPHIAGAGKLSPTLNYRCLRAGHSSDWRGRHCRTLLGEMGATYLRDSSTKFMRC